MRFRNLLIFCLVFLLVVSSGSPIWAVEFRGIPVTGLYEIPENLDFQVRNICSEHNFFYQVSAREDGSFLVYYRQANNGASDGIFGTVYVDMFDESGRFLYEISFDTTEDLVVEYTDQTVVFYFYNHILTYNPGNGIVEGYRIADEAAIQNGIFDELRKPEFQVGQWEYNCRKATHGYTKLTRTDGVVTQELLSLPGSGFNANVVLGVVLAVCLLPLIAFFVICCTKKKTNKK